MLQFTGTILEIEATLADLGIASSAACNQNMEAAIYFDGGTIDPDDNTPDSGTVNIGCGGPTAIILSNIEAENNTPILIAAAGSLLLLASGGVVLAYKRRRA